MHNLFHLPFFGIIKVSGRDAVQFLHNQLSNDIEHLPNDVACYATYNTAQGRVIANFVVYKNTDVLYLITAQDLIEKVIKRLRMFVLRSLVVLEDVSQNYFIAGKLPEHSMNPALPEIPILQFPAPYIDGLQEVHLPHGGMFVIFSQDIDRTILSTDDTLWRLYEIEHAYPWVSLATTEICVAQMLNQHLIGGVHFRKGCYPGQEIIARAQYRGKVKRGLLVMLATGDIQAGDKIINHELNEQGIVINSVLINQQNHILAVIKYNALSQELFTEKHVRLEIKQIFFDLEDKS